jgi:hypothetical protein
MPGAARVRQLLDDGVLLIVVIFLFPVAIVLVGLPLALGIRLLLRMLGP